jgi:hypothetical protein
MTRATTAKKTDRLAHVNDLIKTISDYGRRFFYNKERDRVARMLIGPKGHLYFQDDYTGKAIYVAYQGRWSGFSHGGTLKTLVEALANYVRTGQQLSIGWIGPERFDDSNIWGYAEDEMAKCRAAALTNPAIKRRDAATA